MAFQFTPEQIEQFQTEGFLAVDDFWTPTEIAAMRADLERLKSEGKLRNVATDGDGKTHSSKRANLQLCPMSPHSSLFRAMPFTPKVIEAVEQLIGGPIMLHLDQVFLKPGGHGAGTNWHQDNDYFGIKKTVQGTALWTAVHDANEQNGAMRMIPRAFNTPLEHTRDPDSDHHVRCYPDESKAELMEMKAGGVVFFNYGTPHATGPNHTEHERAGVALHFLTVEANESARGGTSLKPLLSGPNATGGEAEFGKRIAGTWEAEVESALASAK
jgi:ectoine hydroxylase-related dioxygenase (phytanoyl-CoA dioxygenase family)